MFIATAVVIVVGHIGVCVIVGNIGVSIVDVR